MSNSDGMGTLSACRSKGTRRNPTQVIVAYHAIAKVGCAMDLNLLTALDTLLTEVSVTGAARKLGLECVGDESHFHPFAHLHWGPSVGPRWSKTCADTACGGSERPRPLRSRVKYGLCPVPPGRSWISPRSIQHSRFVAESHLWKCSPARWSQPLPRLRRMCAFASCQRTTPILTGLRDGQIDLWIGRRVPSPGPKCDSISLPRQVRWRGAHRTSALHSRCKATQLLRAVGSAVGGGRSEAGCACRSTGISLSVTGPDFSSVAARSPRCR